MQEMTDTENLCKKWQISCPDTAYDEDQIGSEQ